MVAGAVKDDKDDAVAGAGANFECSLPTINSSFLCAGSFATVHRDLASYATYYEASIDHVTGYSAYTESRFSFVHLVRGVGVAGLTLANALQHADIDYLLLGVRGDITL